MKWYSNKVNYHPTSWGVYLRAEYKLEHMFKDI